MSIDHGKLLALADAMDGDACDMTLSDGWREACNRYGDALRALAQPAEAVECGDCDAGWQWFEGYGREHRVKCETCGGKGAKPAEAVEGAAVSRAWGLVERWEQPEIDGEVLNYEERLRFMGFAAMLRSALDGTDAAQGAVAEVSKTLCDCHPETCCCGEYTLKIGSYALTGSKECVQKIADAVNATHPQAAPAQGAVDEWYIGTGCVFCDMNVGHKGQACTAAHPQAATAQGGGWKLVPVVPTARMYNVFVDGYALYGFTASYDAMLAAAPAPERE